MATSTESFTPTPAVLRNQGAPVRVHRLDEHGSRVSDASGEPVTEIRYLRFDHNALCDIEDVWGATSALEDALREAPSRTIRRLFALLWGYTTAAAVAAGMSADGERQAGVLLMETERSWYVASVGVAMSLAMGVDPTQAAALYKAGADAAQGQRAIMNRLFTAAGEMMGKEATFLLERAETLSDDEIAVALAEMATEPAADSPGTDGSGSGSGSPDDPSTSSGG